VKSYGSEDQPEAPESEDLHKIVKLKRIVKLKMTRFNPITKAFFAMVESLQMKNFVLQGETNSKRAAVVALF
jgi:hypothetical protein